jgi:glycosyltransferase involved in cell wall biosynthesis
VTTVHVVVPDGIDDPSRPSGGNVYDRRVCGGLAASGWTVHEHRAASHPAAALADVLARVLDGGLVLVDGLVASAASEVIVPRARRLRLVVLLHMPLGVGCEPARPRERAVLSAVASVVTTSQWARQWLLDSYAMPPSRVRVVEPGAEIAGLAPGSSTGGELLCVGAVTPTKGHDVLVAALAAVAELEWRCVCVGALDIEPGFVDDVRRRAERSGIGDRLRFTGPLTGPDLDAAYAGADVLLSASRAETFGMVVTEALAHGLPVVAGRVGGLPEALGRADDGERPGLLVPPDDPHALAAALRRWLVDPEQRERLRKAAQARRLGLPDWSRTSRLLSRVLDEVLRVA